MITMKRVPMPALRRALLLAASVCLVAACSDGAPVQVDAATTSVGSDATTGSYSAAFEAFRECAESAGAVFGDVTVEDDGRIRYSYSGSWEAADECYVTEFRAADIEWQLVHEQPLPSSNAVSVEPIDAFVVGDNFLVAFVRVENTSQVPVDGRAVKVSFEVGDLVVADDGATGSQYSSMVSIAPRDTSCWTLMAPTPKVPPTGEIHAVLHFQGGEDRPLVVSFPDDLISRPPDADSWQPTCTTFGEITDGDGA